MPETMDSRRFGHQTPINRHIPTTRNAILRFSLTLLDLFFFTMAVKYMLPSPTPEHVPCGDGDVFRRIFASAQIIAKRTAPFVSSSSLPSRVSHASLGPPRLSAPLTPSPATLLHTLTQGGTPKAKAEKLVDAYERYAETLRLKMGVILENTWSKVVNLPGNDILLPLDELREQLQHSHSALFTRRLAEWSDQICNLAKSRVQASRSVVPDDVPQKPRRLFNNVSFDSPLALPKVDWKSFLGIPSRP